MTSARRRSPQASHHTPSPSRRTVNCLPRLDSRCLELSLDSSPLGVSSTTTNIFLSFTRSWAASSAIVLQVRIWCLCQIQTPSGKFSQPRGNILGTSSPRRGSCTTRSGKCGEEFSSCECLRAARHCDPRCCSWRDNGLFEKMIKV